MTALSKSMVVMGKYNLKLGLSTTMSPGKRPKGILLKYGQSNPMTIKAIPR
jgi:hypothetical protein